MTSLRPLWVALAALVLLGVPLTAQVNETTTDSQEKELTVAAQEGGCPEGKTFCFDIEEQPGQLEPGDEVNLTLRNDANTSHNAHVTTNDSADPDRQDTPSTAAIAETPTIGPNETASTTFTVPDDADALYIWCDMTGHEAAGMWLTLEVGDDATFGGNESEDSGFGNDTDDNGSEDNQTFGNGSEGNESVENGSRDNESVENRSDENTSSRNASDENESAGNGTSGNASEDDASDSPFGEEGGTDEPLQVARDDGDQDGQRATPIGWTLAIGAVVAAMVVTAVVGRR